MIQNGWRTLAIKLDDLHLELSAKTLLQQVNFISTSCSYEDQDPKRLDQANLWDSSPFKVHMNKESYKMVPPISHNPYWLVWLFEIHMQELLLNFGVFFVLLNLTSKPHSSYTSR